MAVCSIAADSPITTRAARETLAARLPTVERLLDALQALSTVATAPGGIHELRAQRVNNVQSGLGHQSW